METNNEKVVLVTGGSQGIGLAVVKKNCRKRIYGYYCRCYERTSSKGSGSIDSQWI
ncbi:MAG: SDR family oxidoreductase [Phocaeicola dorei]|nr:SDR family oxidoreductase [Phocaeicola dorei]